MTTSDYSVRLEGVDALDLSLGVLRELCDLFLEGAQRSARLVAEGRSVARGAVPTWASAAADIRISKFEKGSLDLGVRAVRLIDVAPEIFAQQQIFPAGTNPDATAFDLFLDAADDATAGRRDSERLDPGVLEVLARTGALFAKGGTRLSVSRIGRPNVVLDPNVWLVIRTLADETPPTRISRVRGVLDTLTISTRAMALRLILNDGRVLRGYAGAVALDRLKDLRGTDVVLEGGSPSVPRVRRCASRSSRRFRRRLVTSSGHTFRRSNPPPRDHDHRPRSPVSMRFSAPCPVMRRTSNSRLR